MDDQIAPIWFVLGFHVAIHILDIFVRWKRDRPSVCGMVVVGQFLGPWGFVLE
jgi:hypothetical protein